jgi:hypothetical protein
MQQHWFRLGQILDPKDNYVPSTNIGSCFIEPTNNHILNIFFTHRNSDNISHISKVKFDLKKKKIIKKSFKKILGQGSYGYFDCHGVSYPALINFKNKKFMFYVGWQKGIKNQFPFKNNIGLCDLTNQPTRISKAPIIPADNIDPLNTGSCYALKKKNLIRLWYTSFLKYKIKRNSFEHIYTIRYATTKNLIDWKKNKRICIHFKRNEFAISKPTVIYYKNKFHMWFCARGKNYKIGYAQSLNGIKWRRMDNKFKIIGKPEKWDKFAMAYPTVIKYKKKLLMVYTGNDYGKTGIGMLETNLD